MLIRTRLSGWIALYADDCGRCFESRRSDRAWEFVERIISAGPINSSRPRDCSLRLQPGSWRANPDEETTDWRAVCGRTARTVRRAGTAKAVSDPYRTSERRTLNAASCAKLDTQRLEFFVRQEFAVERHDHAISLRIFFTLNFHVEVDSAHNAVAEFLMDQRFDRWPVDLNQFIESVNRWVHRFGFFQ